MHVSCELQIKHTHAYTTCLSPWPGDNRDRDNTRKHFQGGCSERIRVKRNHAFGPPQRYQITADTSPTTPRALAGRQMLVSLSVRVCVCVFWQFICECQCERTSVGKKIQLTSNVEVAAVTRRTREGQIFVRCWEACQAVRQLRSISEGQTDGWKWDVNKIRMRPAWNKDIGSNTHAVPREFKYAGGKQRRSLCPLQETFTNEWGWF